MITDCSEKVSALKNVQLGRPYDSESFPLTRKLSPSHRIGFSHKSGCLSDGWHLGKGSLHKQGRGLAAYTGREALPGSRTTPEHVAPCSGEDNRGEARELTPTLSEVYGAYLDDAEVTTERSIDTGGRLDILIELRSARLLVAIENKIGARESRNQLRDYREWAEETAREMGNPELKEGVTWYR